jgi:hypothetical protein
MLASWRVYVLRFYVVPLPTEGRKGGREGGREGERERESENATAFGLVAFDFWPCVCVCFSSCATQAHFYAHNSIDEVAHPGSHVYRPVFTCVEFGHSDATIAVEDEEKSETDMHLSTLVPRVRHVEYVSTGGEKKLVLYGRNFGDRSTDLKVLIGGERCDDVEVCHIVCRECESNMDCGDGFCIFFQGAREKPTGFCSFECPNRNECPCNSQCYTLQARGIIIHTPSLFCIGPRPLVSRF